MSKPILNLDYENQTILFISDMHIPYHHQDSMEFLSALKEVYDPDLVISLGDLGDFHAISFHDTDPDLYSAGEELEQLKAYSQELEEIFPSMFIVGSNHGDLALRKALSNGLPRSMIREFNDIYGVGDDWFFVDDITIRTKADIPDIYVAHSIRKNAIQVAQQRGQRFIQGHFHESFGINYAGNPNSLLWGVNSGCLIDKTSQAFAYGKLNLNRPILGTVVVENGIPTCLPMVLSKEGRWIQEVL